MHLLPIVFAVWCVKTYNLPLVKLRLDVLRILTSHAQELSCQSYVYCNTKPLGLMALLDTIHNPLHEHKALTPTSHLRVDTDKAAQYE